MLPTSPGPVSTIREVLVWSFEEQIRRWRPRTYIDLERSLPEGGRRSERRAQEERRVPRMEFDDS